MRGKGASMLTPFLLVGKCKSVCRDRVWLGAMEKIWEQVMVSVLDMYGHQWNHLAGIKICYYVARGIPELKILSGRPKW